MLRPAWLTVLSLLTAACPVPGDDPSADPERADYGDAPDGGDAAYPTLASSNGARALDATGAVLAASAADLAVSLEQDADDADDPDGEPNQARERTDLADEENRDDHDNGIVSASITDGASGPELALTLGIGLVEADRTGTWYVNALFDHDVDGDWSGADLSTTGVVGALGGPALDDEHVLVDAAVTPGSAEVAEVTLSIPLVGALSREGTAPPYLRLMVSDAPVGSGWTGEGAVASGEIEDWAVTGLEQGYRFDCRPNGGFLLWTYDFGDLDVLPLNCKVARPAGASTAAEVTVAFTFDVLGAPPDAVEIDCGMVNAGSVVLPAGASSAPVACVANQLAEIDGAAIVTARLRTDASDGVSVSPGKASTLSVSLGGGLDGFLFTDSTVPDGPQDQPLDNCIGLSRTYEGPYGGNVYRVGSDGSCSVVANDGEALGTFALSGGNGFGGDGALALAPMTVRSSWLLPGDVVEIRKDGLLLDEGGFSVPAVGDSTQVFSFRFSGGLAFGIQVEVTAGTPWNTVTQTVLSATRPAATP